MGGGLLTLLGIGYKSDSHGCSRVEEDEDDGEI